MGCIYLLPLYIYLAITLALKDMACHICSRTYMNPTTLGAMIYNATFLLPEQ